MMMARTIPDICRSHTPYSSLLMAQRAADVHPIYARIHCAKCDAGWPFEPFRCPDDPTHWHTGHDRPREDDIVMATTTVERPAAPPAPLRGGDMWVAVSARGKGQPVEITRVNNVNVYFRAYGRGADASQTFKLAHEAFRVRYAPLQLADDRQKRLARDERSFGPAPIDGTPVESDPITEAIEAVQAEPSSAPPVAAPTVVETERPRRYGAKPPKLTGEQAREIWQLREGGGDAKEIAATYDITPSMVYAIHRRRDYGWATERLAPRPSQTDEAPPAVQPHTPVPETTKEAPIVAPAPEPVRLPTAAAPVPDRLSGEAADAIEFLLEYAGQPLPKFMQIDLDGIRRIALALRGRA